MTTKSLVYLRDGMTFPEPHTALLEPNGLLAVSDDLDECRILSAYRAGIFPWFSEGDPVMWWSPDPRAVLFVNSYRPNKRFIRFLNSIKWSITINKAFDKVIEACALRQEGTWITSEIIAAYTSLHLKGYASSIEVWDGNNLIGGLYGVHQGAIFCGESMFSRQSNASKVAFHHLISILKQLGGELIDCQILNPFTASLGAVEIRRDDFLKYLRVLQEHKITFDSISYQSN